MRKGILLKMIIVVLILVTMQYVIGFRSQSTPISLRWTLSIHMSATTPLVANGKRVEAIPGSSMMEACKKLGLRVPTVRVASRNLFYFSSHHFYRNVTRATVVHAQSQLVEIKFVHVSAKSPKHHD